MGHDSLKDDSRWMYGVPPKSNANYAWIQHYLHHLSPQGMAGIVMSNGSLSTNQKEEKVIRKGIVNDDKLDCVIRLPDNLFTNTPIPACIWILTNSKINSQFRDRKGETLFIDCRRMGALVNRKLRELTDDDITKIAGTYQNWRSRDNFEKYEDELGFCRAVTTENEIAEHEYILVPGRYVGAPPMGRDEEVFEVKINKNLSEIKQQFDELSHLANEIKKNMESVGFDI